MADDVAAVGSPGTLWRVGRNPEPLTVVAPTAHDLRAKRAGNRFDVPGAGVIYCASTLEACFAETLARFRPKLDLAQLVADEWKAAGHLRPGSVPAGWRHRRTAVEVSLDQGYQLLRGWGPGTDGSATWRPNGPPTRRPRTRAAASATVS